MDEFDYSEKLEGRKSLEMKMPGATNIVMILIVLIGAIVSLGEFSLTVMAWKVMNRLLMANTKM